MHLIQMYVASIRTCLALQYGCVLFFSRYIFPQFIHIILVFSIDKHFGEYTLGEIPLTRSFKLDFGRWGKALSVDR